MKKNYAKHLIMCVLMALPFVFASCEKEMDEYLYVKTTIPPQQTLYVTANGVIASVQFAGEIDGEYAKYRHTYKGQPLFTGDEFYVCTQAIGVDEIVELMPEIVQFNEDLPLGIGKVTLTTDSLYKGALNWQNATIVVKFKNVPDPNDVHSLTMRVLNDPAEVPVYFSGRQEYSVKENKLNELSQVEAISNTLMYYGENDSSVFQIFPYNLSSKTLQLEILKDDAHAYYLQVKGQNFQKNKTYEYEFDFKQAQLDYACPYNTAYGINMGKPVQVADMLISPKNIGYDLYCEGYERFMFHDTWAVNKVMRKTTPAYTIEDVRRDMLRGEMPYNWSLPTLAQMQALATMPHSAPWTVGATYGIWVGPTADTTPNDGKNIFMPFSGYWDMNLTPVKQSEEGYYVLAEEPHSVAHITAAGIEIITKPADFYAGSAIGIYSGK